jgi:HEAT repeat protein
MTLTELRDKLSAIEPDESTFSDISSEEIPLLEQLLDDDEAWMAARSVFALSRLNNNDAFSVLTRASTSNRDEVRVAVAAAAVKLPTEVASRLLNVLLDDSDLGVKKFAIQSITRENAPILQTKLRSLVESDLSDYIQRNAQERMLELGITE